MRTKLCKSSSHTKSYTFYKIGDKFWAPTSCLTPLPLYSPDLAEMYRHTCKTTILHWHLCQLLILQILQFRWSLTWGIFFVVVACRFNDSTLTDFSAIVLATFAAMQASSIIQRKVWNICYQLLMNSTPTWVKLPILMKNLWMVYQWTVT